MNDIKMTNSLMWLQRMVVRGPDIEACIDWPGGRFPKGYGRVRHDGRRRNAHRVSLILATGQDPRGLQAAHTCGRQLCVNPRHLRWATQAENEADKAQHGTKRRGGHVNGGTLTEQQVLNAYSDPRATQAVADDLGVGYDAVWKIRNGINWSWLTGHNKAVG